MRTEEGDRAEFLRDWMPEKDFAVKIDKTVRTVQSMRARRDVPDFMQIGRDTYYHIPSIPKWLERRTIKPRERGRPRG
jgi:hypothetical protein